MGGRAVYAQRGASLNIVETLQKILIVFSTMSKISVHDVQILDVGGHDDVDVSANEGAVDVKVFQ